MEEILDNFPELDISTVATDNASNNSGATSRANPPPKAPSKTLKRPPQNRRKRQRMFTDDGTFAEVQDIHTIDDIGANAQYNGKRWGPQKEIKAAMYPPNTLVRGKDNVTRVTSSMVRVFSGDSGVVFPKSQIRVQCVEHDMAVCVAVFFFLVCRWT